MDASPFAHILYTNSVPSDSECKGIFDLLAGPRVEAADLTQEINRLQSLLEELAKQRDHLNHFIDSHLALVSPARRLPDDVVREIFVAALPSDRNAIMSGSEAPLLLCHISQRWRNLALSTPRLWTSLHIIIPSFNLDHARCGSHPKLHQINNAVKSWLSRSGSLPLAISIVGRPASIWPSTTVEEIGNRSASDTIMRSLIQFSSRWDYIRIKTTGNICFQSLAVLSPVDVPILHSVVLDGWHDEDGLFAFLKTPSLTAASLRPLAHSQQNLICWEGLRHLALHSDQYTGQAFSTRNMLSILQRCSQLESCVLTLDVDEAESHTQAPSCYMAHIWQLSVIDVRYGPGDRSDFFRHLILPDLRVLQYRGDYNFQVTTLPFVPMVSSSTGLEQLRLSVPNLSTDALIDILRAAPALKELCLRNRHFRLLREPLNPGLNFGMIVSFLY
ncbi:hypothetical protein B0H11DRAFT_804914 [Mycena galericulata]|nr:hypothetical protein B0H11DRAFT_804914 [Mycena galericulata]